MSGPKVRFSEEIHATKYRAEGETFRDAMKRVARALADDEPHFQHFREALLSMRFMPAGRVQRAMGSPDRVTPYNCYVSGSIEDSFVEGEGSIMQRATEAAATMRMGGGIGYNFGTLRPRGALIKKLGSRSSGPLAFMEIYNAVCRCVASAGHRQGAQMGVMPVDHPDIEEFVAVKQNTDKLTGFNISVGVTDEFMRCLRSGDPFPLRFGGTVYRSIDARALWAKIMQSTWDWAEPGVLFMDTINRENNLWYCETIAATNPCGEQPLPPFGACLLGSFNLVKYLRREGMTFLFDWDLFGEDIAPVVRAMDNVIDRAVYPLPQQRLEAKSKRRIGLGVTGLANAIEAMGYAYGSNGFLELERNMLRRLKVEAYRASALLAEEKGCFALFDRDKYLEGPFIKRLPPDVRDLIWKHGIRNSHLTSIAPTGTISLAADNVSSGIEPVFSRQYTRTYRTFEGDRDEVIQDYGLAFLGTHGKLQKDVTIAEHLAVLATAQGEVDSACSKTCNIPGTVSQADFAKVYETAWELGCKGITTYRTDGKRGAVLRAEEPSEEAKAEEGLSCYLDQETGRRECA
jgi:ribonucleoside-diphosphate reductase alpha chain